MVIGRIAARIEDEETRGTKRCATRVPQEDGADNGNSNGESMRFAPKGDRIRELAQEEAVWLKREIELRFVRSGKLELPQSRLFTLGPRH